MIRKNAKICALVLAMVMMLSTVAFAAEGDHYTKDGKLIYSSNKVRADVKARNHVRALPGEFKMEVKGELYDLVDVNAAFDKDEANWKEILTGKEPVDELKVVEVSAINNSQIRIEFNKEVQRKSVQELENYYIGLTKNLSNDVKTLNPNAFKATLLDDNKTVIISGTNSISGTTITTNVIWADENSDADQTLTSPSETRKFVPMNTDGNATVLKDRTVYVQLRNIRTADGKLASAMETSFYAADKIRPAYAKEEYKLEKTTATDITIDFTEPVHLDLNKVKAYVNSTEVQDVEYVDDALNNVRNHRKLKITFGSDVELVEGDNKLEIVGLEDFSGNTTRPSNLVTNIKVAESAKEAPKFVQIKQVYDAAFFVEFDRAITDGIVTVKNLGNQKDDAVFTLSSGTWAVAHTSKASKMDAKLYQVLPNGNHRYLIVLDNEADNSDDYIYNGATKAIREIVVEDYKSNGKEGTKHTKSYELIKDKKAPTVVEAVAKDESIEFTFKDEPFNGGIELIADLDDLTKPLVLTHVNEKGRTVKAEITLEDAWRGDIFALKSVNAPAKTNNVLELKVDKLISATGLSTANKEALESMVSGTELKSGITVTLPYGLVLDDKDELTSVDTPQYDQSSFIGATVEVKGGTKDSVPVVTEGDITYNSAIKAIVVKIDGEDIDAKTVTNKANYTLDGKSVSIDKIEFTENDEALVYLSQNTIARNGSYDFGVKNIATKSGAKMLPVEASVYLHDNTQPEMSSAIVTADNKIEVKFNEDILDGVAANATVANAEDNFVVSVAGAKYTVKTVTKKDSRTLVLELNDKIDYSKAVNVEITNTVSDDMFVKDVSGNLATETTVRATVDLD